MTTAPTPPVAAPANDLSTWMLRALWLIAVVLAVRFVIVSSVQYFDVSESVYGRWWSHRFWLLGHVAGGTLALLIGPVQFIAKIRENRLALHRGLGHVYLIGILLGSTCAMVLAFTTAMAVHWTWAVSLLSLALPWMVTALMGYRAIRLERRRQHKEWMIRSYVLTFAFVVFRVFNDDLFPVELPQDFITQGPTFGWVAWAIPLFFTEVCLQWNKRN